MKTFDDYLEFEIFLNSLNLNAKTKREILDHERAHMETATKLGYSGKYFIEDKIGQDRIREYRGGFLLNEKVTNKEHIRAILLAPKNPSLSDLEQLAEIE